MRSGMTPQQPGYAPTNTNVDKKPLIFGILSVSLYLILEFISSLPFGYGSIVGVGFGIAAICLGVKSKKRGVRDSKIAAGIITGIVGLSISALWLLILFIASL